MAVTALAAVTSGVSAKAFPCIAVLGFGPGLHDRRLASRAGGFLFSPFAR